MEVQVGSPGTLRGHWKPTDNLELTASVQNILDQLYRVHGSGNDSPGINMLVSADASF